MTATLQIATYLRPWAHLSRWIQALILGCLVLCANSPGATCRNLPTPDCVAQIRRARKRRRYAPREASADYSRYSSEFQDEATIESQQECCRQRALQHGQAITPRHEYVDRAVSGTKLRRDGLDQLLADAEAGEFSRVYFYSLSRLARESIIGMTVLKRLVCVYRIRIVSVTEGIDSDQPNWEQVAQMCLMQHEKYIRDLSENTFRGQKSNIRNRYSNGDYCFGYTSKPVAESDGTRRGRHARPRKEYAIDPVASEWVKRIFHWFVRERRSIRWIARELNRLGAPKDHRATTRNWRHQYVTRLLANRKFIGDWPWGEMKNIRDPETGIISQEPRDVEETEQYRRKFADLRLIDDETFTTAQALLAANRETFVTGRDKDGQFVPGRDGAPPPATHLLGGLIVCDNPVAERVCGRPFHMGGAYSRYMYCPGHAEGECACQTMLPRHLAEDLILQQIGSRILDDPKWLAAVYDSTRTAWFTRQQTLPNELRDCQAALEEVNRKVSRLINAVEGADEPDPDLVERLAERRAERRELEVRLRAAQAAAAEQPCEPTLAWVQERLADLAVTLRDATPAAAYALRDLVGGQILVREIRREGKSRHFLRGTFRICLGRLAAALGGGATAEVHELLYEEIAIDFVRENPLDARSDEAKRLWDENLPNREIANRLKCSRSMVTKLLKHWGKRHGETLPDGRARRSQIPHSPDDLPLYQEIADRVMELYHRGVELGDIATVVGHDRNTITKTVKFWHETRGLAVPDGRTRRKSLPRVAENIQELPPETGSASAEPAA